MEASSLPPPAPREANMLSVIKNSGKSGGSSGRLFLVCSSISFSLSLVLLIATLMHLLVAWPDLVVAVKPEEALKMVGGWRAQQMASQRIESSLGNYNNEDKNKEEEDDNNDDNDDNGDDDAAFAAASADVAARTGAEADDDNDNYDGQEMTQENRMLARRSADNHAHSNRRSGIEPKVANHSDTLLNKCNDDATTLSAEGAHIERLLARYYRLDAGPSRVGVASEHSQSARANSSSQLLELPRPKNVTVLIISWYPPILKLSWNLNELNEADASKLDFYEKSANQTESNGRQLGDQFDLELAMDQVNNDDDEKKARQRRPSPSSSIPPPAAGKEEILEANEAEEGRLAGATRDCSDRGNCDNDGNLSIMEELRRRRFLVRKSLTCFQVTYSTINSRFKVTEEYPPYLRIINLERLLPATEYSLYIVAVYLGKYRLFSDRVQFISPTDNESRRFKENTYRPIHRYPDEKRELRIGLAQVRSEELTLVVIAVVFWIATIYLFFNNWGKIRMLEPYQPAYREVDGAESFAHHHPSLHNLPPNNQSSSVAMGTGSGGTGSGPLVMTSFCGGFVSNNNEPQQEHHHHSITSTTVISPNNEPSIVKLAPKLVGSGGSHKPRSSEGALHLIKDSDRKCNANKMLLNKRFETFAGDSAVISNTRRTNTELSYLFQAKAQALAKTTTLWSKQQQQLKQQQYRSRLANCQSQLQPADFEMLRRTSQSLLRKRQPLSQRANSSTHWTPVEPKLQRSLVGGGGGGGLTMASHKAPLEARGTKESVASSRRTATNKHEMTIGLERGSSVTSRGQLLMLRYHKQSQAIDYSPSSGCLMRLGARSLDRQAGNTQMLDRQAESSSPTAISSYGPTNGQQQQQQQQQDNCKLEQPTNSSGNKLRRLLFMSKSHQHHHIATSTSSSILINNGVANNGGDCSMSNSVHKINSTSMDNGISVSVKTKNDDESNTESSSKTRLLSISSSSLPMSLSAVSADEQRLRHVASSGPSPNGSVRTSLVKLTPIQLKRTDCKEFEPEKQVSGSGLVEHHILIEPPSPPNQRHLLGSPVGGGSNQEPDPSSDRDGIHDKDKGPADRDPYEQKQQQNFHKQCASLPLAAELPALQSNKSVEIVAKRQLLAPIGNRCHPSHEICLESDKQRHKIELANQSQKQRQRRPQAGNDDELKQFENEENFNNSGSDLTTDKANTPYVADYPSETSCPAGNSSVGHQPEICLEEAPPNDSLNDAFVKLANYQSQSLAQRLSFAAQLSQCTDYCCNQSCCTPASDRQTTGTTSGSVQLCCHCGIAHDCGGYLYRQQAGSSFERLPTQQPSEESEEADRSQETGSARPRMGSVFVASPYTRAHRDSFAMLRALSQKKSKSAEDVAYLSSLVLQIWVRDRNPLLQSASQQQLSNGQRRQSSSQEKANRRQQQQRPKSSLTVAQI